MTSQTGSALTRRCIQWKMLQIFFQPMFPESVSVHTRKGWRKDLREVGILLFIGHHDGLRPSDWSIQITWQEYWPLMGRSYLDLVTRTVTDCFLQFLSLILSSQGVVTSLLFAHFCFTPSHCFSQRWIPTPWLTLTQGPLFLFTNFLSQGCHLFFSYALLWYYFSIVAVNKLPGSA